MSMDFYLDRQLQAALREKLATVPGLVEDLSVTITRQARIRRPGLGKTRRQKAGSQLPYHLGASEAADNLHDTLVAWVRFVCEERQIRYTATNDMITLARWLSRNITTLALIEGSEEAFDEIADRIDECRKQVDLPPDDEIYIDPARIEQANRQVLTAGQVEKIANKLGALGTGLNKRRVETLTRNGQLRPCATDGNVRFYRLGDVLDAHHRRVATH